jgi:delta(3,5)-delta(2,4)-dienoyl-CoA isomerase
MAEAISYGPYETILVTRQFGSILHIELNRPDKLNAFNPKLWEELREFFQLVPADSDTRAIVISARGRAFTAGLDLASSGIPGGKSDAGRTAYRIRRFVLRLNESFNAIEACPFPVIVVSHGAVVGAGIDLLCACCIRYASSDAWFTIKEVDVGLAADLGTLQRMPKIIGNEGLVRELAYTSRKFTADEALRMGFVSKVFDTKDQALDGALELAKTIAEKSPLAVAGTKRMLTYARDHTVHMASTTLRRGMEQHCKHLI